MFGSKKELERTKVILHATEMENQYLKAMIERHERGATPLCGINFISIDRAKQIIGTREPNGIYVSQDPETMEWIGIDNRTGDAWTDKFDTLLECALWF